MAQATTQNPLNARLAYLNAAVKRSQEIPAQAYTAGGANNFTFPHAGVGRFARISFSGTLSRTEGATVGTATASPFYPFNIISNVILTDYTGTTRVNAKPYHLYLRELGMKFGFDPSATPINAGYSTSVWAASIPTGTINTTTTAPCVFSFEVPIALHRNTTEGSLPFNIPDGDTTLQIQMNALTGGTIDYPFAVTGGTSLTLSGTWQVTYYYYDAPANTPLPMMDFSLIHELVSVRQNTNISAGAEKQFVLETGRTYYQLIHMLVANNAPDTLDVQRVKFLIDGNTPTMDEFLLTYLSRARETYGRDMPLGAFFFNFFVKPWSPASYGSLATSLLLSSGINLGTNYWLDTLKETQYFAKSALTAA